MTTLTPNLGLPRPEETDPFGLAEYNAALDAMDTNCAPLHPYPMIDKGGAFVNVKAEGIVGDGTDEGAKWQTMLNAYGRNTVYLVPPPIAFYGIATTPVLTRSHDGVSFIGMGPRLVATPNSGKGVYFKRLSTNPLFQIGSLSVDFERISFDQNGATYTTGVCVHYVLGAGYCSISKAGFFHVPDGTYCVDVDTPYDAGTGFANGVHMVFDRINAAPINNLGPLAFVKYPQDFDPTWNSGAGNGGNAGSHRYCIAVKTDMPVIDASLGADDEVCLGCDGYGFLSGPNSQKISYAGGRFLVPPSGGRTIYGNNHVIAGNTVNGGNTTFAVGSGGSKWSGNAMPNAFTVLDLGFNDIDQPENLNAPARVVYQNGDWVFARSTISQTDPKGGLWLPASTGEPKFTPPAYNGIQTRMDRTSGAPRFYCILDGIPWNLPFREGAQTLASDTFTKADATGPTALGAADVGGTWTQGSSADTNTSTGILGISSNQAYYAPPSGSPSDGHAWLDLGKADVVLTCDVTTTNASNTVGLLCRRVDGNNYYILRMKVNGWGLLQNLAGVRSTIASGTCVLASGVQTKVRLVAYQNLVEVWVGGTLTSDNRLLDAVRVYQGALTNFTGATKHGISVASAAGAERVDNFLAQRI